MNKLTIINVDGKHYVDSREVATMVDKNHAHLLRDIKGYIDIMDPNPVLDSANFFIFDTYYDAQNQERPCYLLTRKGCDMVANKMTGEKGVLFTATYVTKFEEMENSLKLQPKDSYMIEDPIARAEAWITEAKERQSLTLQLEAQRPKVIFAEALEVSSDSILIGELAKILRQNGVIMGQNRLFEKLREDGYIIKKRGESYNQPTQYSMELKLFEIKKRTINNPDGSVRPTTTTKVTGKGQIYFVNKFKNQLEKRAV